MITCPHCGEIISREPDDLGTIRVPTRMLLLKRDGRAAVVCPNKRCRQDVPVGRLWQPRLVLRVDTPPGVPV